MKRVKKIVYIKWFDSYSNNALMTQEEVEKDSEFILEDTGFLITEKGDYIRYASSSYEDGRWKYVHSIPKCNIMKKVILRLKQ